MANYYHRVTVEVGFQTLAELQDYIAENSTDPAAKFYKANSRKMMNDLEKVFCDSTGKPIDVSK